MTLALARCLDDPLALLAELRHHGQRRALVGLAVTEEWQALRQAVLGGPTPKPDTNHAQGKATARAALPDPGPPPLESAKDQRAMARPADAMHQVITTWGPAVVLGSGGSSGARRWCLLPLGHLEASAAATAAWLTAQGFDPAACLHLAALPLHHVSGLLPLIRCQCWGAELRWLPPTLLRQPELLADACALPASRPVLLSVVPTQLRRLLACPAGTSWLARCSVIWVGGAALPDDLALRARHADLPLAPCYGATETAAMVCALPPARFLAGESGCGPPLADVELRLEGRCGAIALRTGRLSPGWWQAGRLRPFAAADGWWRSGDAGGWNDMAADAGASLEVRGRLDGAINSGGETVFPEQVRQRLLALIHAARLPVAELLLLSEDDPCWGQRLVALVRLDGGELDGDWAAEGSGAVADESFGIGAEHSTGAEPMGLELLAQLARQLPPSQRPSRWLLCPELAPSAAGKWEQRRWRAWLANHLSRGDDSVAPAR
ncbi:MAG: AMP-binding protein [Synechococcaceae cyanobacterium]